MTVAAAGAWKPIAAAAFAAIAVMGIGALMTDLGPWYASLRMPAWKPPDWLFGPAWTLIYALWAVAAILAWQGATSRAGHDSILVMLSLNAFLNILWSALFFRLHHPDWALAEVVLLWLSILWLIVTLCLSSRLAGLLLVPYLAWVSFAGALNLAVVRLNDLS